MTNQAHQVHGLYAITRPVPDLVDAVRQALRGGARIIQFRDKQTASRDDRLAQARTLIALCTSYGAPLIVNDDPVLARDAGASGVHLGRDDDDIARARTLLGPRALIGVSCYNDLARARAAQAQGADYVAFGSFYPSGTKPQAVRAQPELLTRARAELVVPIVAIGGITPENGAPLIAAGADALAVIEGVFGQGDIEAAARRYARLFSER